MAPARSPYVRLAAGLSLSWRCAAQIRVMSPYSLVNQFSETFGRIEGSTATFGAPFYGERVLGRLVWGESKGQAHCRENDYEVPQPDTSAVTLQERTEVKPLNIVLVRRGMCSFVTKVRVAQAKGAHAVIIVDKEDSVLTTKDIKRIIVADDGYGQGVEIPSMLIAKTEGQHLIEAAQANQQIIIELAWDVPTDNVVLVDQWMSSASRESFRFLKEWTPNRKALNEVIKFVPHYHVFGMSASNDYNDLCADTTAEYCAEDPDGSGPVTGSMVLDEDVRQLCIHEKYKVSRTPDAASIHKIEYASQYWDYVSQSLDECPLDGQDPLKRFGKACSERLMQQVGIDATAIDDCFTRTRLDKLKKQREDVAWSPRALRINGWRYSGALDADLVTRAICAGFITQPDACKTLTEPMHPVLKKIYQTTAGGVSFSSFFMTLLVIIALAAGGLFLYKKSLTNHIHSTLREEVMLEVQAQMGSYKQMA